MDGWVGGWVGGWKDKKVNRWLDGWEKGWLGGCLVGWIHSRNLPAYYPRLLDQGGSFSRSHLPKVMWSWMDLHRDHNSLCSASYKQQEPFP